MKKPFEIVLLLLSIASLPLSAESCGYWTFRDLTLSSGGPPSSILGSLTSNVTPATRHVFYSDVKGHIFELYKRDSDPDWTLQDLTALTGAPAKNVEDYGNLAAYAVGSDEHVFFIDNFFHVQSLNSTGGNWSVTDLTVAASAPAADIGSALTTYTSGSGEHVVFVDQNRDVGELYTSAAQADWHWLDLSSLVNGSPHAGSPQLTSYVIGSSSHVVYADYDGTKIVELYNSGKDRAWYSRDVVSYPQGQVEIGLSSLVLESVPHVFYAEVWYAWPNVEPVVEAFKSPAKWQAPNRLTGKGFWGPAPLGGRLAACAVGPNEYLIHVGASRHLYSAGSSDGGLTWRDEDLTALSGAPDVTASRQPLSMWPMVTEYTVGSQAHIVYLAQNGDIVDVFYSDPVCSQ